MNSPRPLGRSFKSARAASVSKTKVGKRGESPDDRQSTSIHTIQRPRTAPRDGSGATWRAHKRQRGIQDGLIRTIERLRTAERDPGRFDSRALDNAVAYPGVHP
eukprot:179814-Prorocentrum_minimum.AAC.1